MSADIQGTCEQELTLYTKKGPGGRVSYHHIVGKTSPPRQVAREVAGALQPICRWRKL